MGCKIVVDSDISGIEIIKQMEYSVPTYDIGQRIKGKDVEGIIVGLYVEVELQEDASLLESTTYILDSGDLVDENEVTLYWDKE